MRMLLAFVLAATLSATAVAGAASNFPDEIALPNGFQPEGITVRGDRFFVGSIPTGAVYSGSVRTGEGSILVPAHEGRMATGLKVDRGRIFVAGHSTGAAHVYDVKTGADIASYQLSSGGSFINDVVVTRDSAWFTDSLKPVLYRVPLGPDGAPGPASAVETVELSGDFEQVAGFNLNGIDAARNGTVLILVQSATGKLFTSTTDGVTKEIVLADGESVPRGDGILLDGRVLYVVQNTLNVIAQIKLSADLQSGRVLDRIGHPRFDVPTTIGDRGQWLYAVNARFGTPATPDTPYWITRVQK